MVLIVMAAGCGMVSRDEVARVRSPDGSLDAVAVVVETNGGATTSFGYDVLLMPASGHLKEGQRAVSLYGAGRNKHAYGVNLVWTGPTYLREDIVAHHTLQGRISFRALERHGARRYERRLR